jgi:membrane fusion protein (multidrug efflux system)
VYFSVPEARYLEPMTKRDQVKEGSPIELLLAGGGKFPHVGKLAAIDGQFEKDTGSIAFRADFPNPEGLLRHGQSGTVSTRESLKNAVVIPQRATFEQGDRRYVYVVGKDDVAHRREVLVRNVLEGLFVIDKGLAANDRIVVDGVRQVRDGEKVQYEFRTPEAASGRPHAP